MLTFKQLEAVHWVTKSGSFAGAAERLHTTQSAISKRIKELEEFLGLVLFDRSRRTARLTQKGREILGLCEELLSMREKLLSAADKSAVSIRRFRIGVTELIALTWLPRLVEILKIEYPNLELQPEIDMSASLCEKLTRGALDFIAVPGVFNENSMVSVPLCNLKLSWMCSPKLYASPEPLSLKQISELPILMQMEKSGVDIGLERWFRERDLSVRRVYAGNSLSALSALTISGFGISFLPSQYFSDLVETGRLRVVQCEEDFPIISYKALFTRDGPVAFCTKVAGIAQSLCNFSKPL
ncbi:MAG: LysR family transcriptional regulator [Burkholderiales bacterium]